MWSTPNGAIIFVSSVPERPHVANCVNMKKKNKTRVSDPEMRAEYDFSKGIRGKYAKKFARGTNIVVLEPDVARIFPDSASVNKALRALAEVAEKQKRRAAR